MHASSIHPRRFLGIAFAGALAVSGFGVSACGDDAAGEGGDEPSPQCEASTYVAFDTANHQNQDIRVAAHSQIGAWLALAGADAAVAAERFGEAKTLYTDAVESASLREKVQGRLDEHLAGAPLQGDRLDATLMAWLEYGETLAAGQELEATIARQWVDKTFLEFFFLSVHHEVLAGARKNWDEGFGYYGCKADNAEGALESVAAVAFKRDATNGTSLEPTIYNHLIDGSCELDLALDEAGAEEVVVADAADLAPIVDAIDTALIEVFAYSAGHEAYEMQEQLEAADRDDAELFIKAAELIPYFLPVERVLRERGGEAASAADEIRGFIDAMPVWDPATLDTTETTWIDDLEQLEEGMTVPERIIERLEATLGISVQG